MEFTLRYSGVLPPVNSRDSRMAEKHAIRLHFHRQLADLWTNNGWLAGINPKTLQLPIVSGPKFDVCRPISGPAGFFYRYQLNGFDFVPLVTLPLEAHCHLAIRLHCPTGSNSILVGGGDIDNRLKTLFDALRMPTGAAELPASATPDADATFFCLLADDRLITKLTVEIPSQRS